LKTKQSKSWYLKPIRMIKIALFLLLISILQVNAQEKISFPQDFKFDSDLIEGMTIAEITDELILMGITANPAVSSNHEIIKMLTHIDSKNISEIYYELYLDKNNSHKDAGIIVSRFKTDEDLQNNLDKLAHQNNLAYLIKDNYLIMVWSDISRNSEQQINSMVNYYQNKLQAEPYNLNSEHYDEDNITIEEAIME